MNLKPRTAARYNNYYNKLPQFSLNSVLELYQNKQSFPAILVGIIHCARLNQKHQFARDCAKYLSHIRSKSRTTFHVDSRMSGLYDKLITSGLKPISAKRYVSIYQNLDSFTKEGVELYLKTRKSKSSILASIIACARVDDRPDFVTECTELLHQYRQQHPIGYSVPSEKSKQDAIAFPWSKVKEMDDTLTKSLDDCSYSEFLSWIFVRTLNEGLVFRGQEFYTTVINDNDAPNNLNLETGVWTIRDYKTEKNYGERTLELSQKTCELIKTARTRFHITSKYLFTPLKDRSGPPMSQTNFSKFIRRHIGVGTNHLRNLYVSHKLDEGVSRNQRQEMAEVMGHGVNTQIMTYSKHAKTLDDIHTPISPSSEASTPILPGIPPELLELLDKAIDKKGYETVKNVLSAII